MRAKVSADQRMKVDAAAKLLPGKVKAAAKATPDKPVEQVAREVATAAGLGGKDIDALVFLVLAQATRSAQEELKAVTASVKAVNAAKMCKDNACLAAMKPSADYDQKTLDTMRLDLKGTIQGVLDLGQQLQLVLQEASNLYTRSEAARADVSKKFSDHQDGMVQNIK